MDGAMVGAMVGSWPMNGAMIGAKVGSWLVDDKCPLEGMIMVG